MKITKQFLSKVVSDPGSFLKGLSEEDVAEILQYLNHNYYTKGTSAVPDNTYDIIKEHLRSLNRKHPLLKNIGAAIDNDDNRKVKLPVFMGSMDKNKKDTAALDGFTKRFGPVYVVSDKLDGVSGLFEVKSGEIRLYTRGDGVYGQNITHLVPFINGLSKIKPSHDLLVRGEFIISRENFEKVKNKGANARNMVAGLVNAKMPDLKLLKYVEFRAYALINQAQPLEMEHQFKSLISLGFLVPFYRILQKADLTIETLSSILIERRKSSPFEVDGIIVSDNQPHQVEANQNPSYAFAFKDILTMETAEVMVTNVLWNVSKDGYFKPIVEVTPVKLNGVTIKKTTGFNGDFIETNKIGPGAKIIITRSGDVIPYIVKVLTPADSGKAQMPTEVYVWNDTHKEIMVKGDSDELDAKQLEHFFDKIDVKGVSAKSVQKLYDAGMKTIKDVVNASKADFEAVPGLLNKATFHEKLHARLKTLDCLTLMHASNAFGRGFGERKLSLILEAYPKIASSPTFAPSVDDLIKLEGISSISATAFLAGLERYREFQKVAKLHCVPSSGTSKATTKSQLVDQVVVFTGFRNKEWEKAIVEKGGKVGASVTSKTTMIVVKDASSDSKKIQDARDKGVKIVTMQQFEKLLS